MSRTPIELKSCPFCGGDGEVHPSALGAFTRMAFVKCVECGCQSLASHYDNPAFMPQHIVKAAENWNNRPAELELAEARAEIERLNKNMRFAIAINSAMQEAGQDLPDLRGHECLAKHKLLSLFDLWRKKVRPRLPGFVNDEISRRDALIEQMRSAFKACAEFIHYYDQEHNIGDGKVLAQAMAALSAAERLKP